METRPKQPRQAHVLQDILPIPGGLVARCLSATCGAVTPIEVSPQLHWLIARAPLARLQQGLRCTCGARAGVLEPFPANFAAPKSGGRLYLFLA
jgi:hypothetical protein